MDTLEYKNLLLQYIPYPIEDEEQYNEYIKIIDDFLNKGENITMAEEAVLDLFSLIVENYEHKNFDFEDAAPNEVLKHLMEERELKQKDIAHLFGSSKGRASETLSGKRAISKRQAKILAEFFNVSPALFI